ncbi:MAG: hypothetical protein OEV40_21065 [Acidimicrobiia bacterium]|nr:hypothetical protein [Acidimicrobiia bacterium]
MATHDPERDPIWSRLGTTCAYLLAVATLIAVATTGTDAVTEGPIVEAIAALR